MTPDLALQILDYAAVAVFAVTGALATAAVLATKAGVAETPALALCALVTLTLRAGSMAFGWRLPVYRSRASKPESPKRRN